MKILAISDVESKHLVDFFDAAKYTDIDLIVSAGDLNGHYLDRKSVV